MAAVNFYMGVLRGQNTTQLKVVTGTASAGTATDVEIRMQINNGTSATGLTRKDVNLAIDILRSYLNSGSVNGLAGANLPAL